MFFYVFIRIADEMGLNFWLRFLAAGLCALLFLQAFYYFSVINQDTPAIVQSAHSTREQAEQENNDLALATKIRSAMAQTKRLYSLGIGVKSRAGQITLIGEVPSEIDRDLAANVAKEIPGVQEVHNEIQVDTNLRRLGETSAKVGVEVNVEDLEMAANLREMFQAIVELKAQPIEIRVHHRAVTLTGRVATVQQRQRAEQAIRYAPKVASISNQLRIGN